MEKEIEKRLSAAVQKIMAQESAIDTRFYEDETGFWRAHYFPDSPDGVPCLAVYRGPRDHADAMERLANPGFRNEPTFLLQNCTMLFLGGKNHREVRGQIYRVGYPPIRWKAEEAKAVLVPLEGFAADADIETITRSIPPTPPRVCDEPPIGIPVRYETIRRIRRCERSYIMDTAFACRAFNFGTEQHPLRLIPEILLGVCDGRIMRGELIWRRQPLSEALFLVLGDFLLTYGRPRELIVCSDRLYAALSDFCMKTEIVLRKTEAPPELDRLFEKINRA